MKRKTKLIGVGGYLTPAQHEVMLAIMAHEGISNEAEFVDVAFRAYADMAGFLWPEDKLPRGRTPGVPQKRKKREKVDIAT